MQNKAIFANLGDKSKYYVTARGGRRAKLVSVQRGYAHQHGILTAYIFSEDLAGDKNYYSQDAARSRSVKENYQGHRGQRSRSLCNLIGQKGAISTINDLFALN